MAAFDRKIRRELTESNGEGSEEGGALQERGEQDKEGSRLRLLQELLPADLASGVPNNLVVKSQLKL